MEARYFKIGVFVLSALAIGVVFLIAFGAGGKGPEVWFETYLAESVQGLERGSPVRMQGVPLGKVEAIGFVLTDYGADSDLVRVVFSCQLQKVGQADLDLAQERLKRWISDGFRVRLASGGLVGGSYLEMSNVDPKEYPPREITWKPEYAYIPSMPSVMNQLQADAMAVVKDLREADIAGTVAEVKNTLKALRTAMEGDVAATLANIRAGTEGLPERMDRIEKALDEGVIRSLTQLIASFDKLVAEDIGPVTENLRNLTAELEPQLRAFLTELNAVLRDEVRPAIASIRETGTALPETVKRLDGVIARVGILVRREGFDVQDSLRSLRGVLADLKRLTDSAERHPSAVLFGDPPPKSGRDRGN